MCAHDVSLKLLCSRVALWHAHVHWTCCTKEPGETKPGMSTCNYGQVASFTNVVVFVVRLYPEHFNYQRHRCLCAHMQQSTSCSVWLSDNHEQQVEVPALPCTTTSSTLCLYVYQQSVLVTTKQSNLQPCNQYRSKHSTFHLHGLL